MATTAEIAAITAGRERQAAAERKAAEDPASLTEAELTDLRPSVLAETMASGRLAHLGYGPSVRRYR
jgi:hypothetical protein